MQRVNTNAIYMSDIVYNHLDNELVSLRISLDSGNAETYLNTKGRSLFDRVVKNISAYREKTENILLKYVVTNTNSNEQSITDFVELADRLSIKAVCIDTEMYSFGKENYRGLLRFTSDELAAARLLQNLAHKKGLNVQIGYVWTAQNSLIPSRDFNHIKSISELIEENETYKLPETLPDFNNINNAVFSKGIIPKVLSSFEIIVSSLKDKKVVLYGAGNNGKKLLSVLKRYGIKVNCFCDKAKAGQVIDGVEVKNIHDIKDDIGDDVIVILTPFRSREIVAEFNKENLYQLKDCLYYIDDIRYSDRVLEEII